MNSPVRKIVGGQEEVHPDLERLVSKHTKKKYLKPIQKHNEKAFKKFEQKVKSFAYENLVLDLGAGTGESSFHWAISHPKDLVISIDRSEVRLKKGAHKKQENLFYLRTDIEDFMRLFLKGQYQANRIHLYYPNPYPKAGQINKRWYAHPIFETFLTCSKLLELRTNWELYAEEFSLALGYFGKKSTFETYIPEQTITAFETKYFDDGQPLYRLVTE